MKKFLLRISLVFLIVFLQINFLNLLFSQNYTFNISVLVIIAWLIVAGFEKTWKWIIFLGFLNDIFMGNRIGLNILFFIIFAYTLSFISRRFIIERRFSGFLLVVIFILSGLALSEIFSAISNNYFHLSDVWSDLKNDLFSWKKTLWSNILALICFYFIYELINRMEKHISRFENRLKINL